MTADSSGILPDLQRAVTLLGEAQNAYDFKAYVNASQMRRQANGLLQQLFSSSAVLRENFPIEWSLLQRDEEDCGFFYEQLEKARKLLSAPAGENSG